MAVKHCRVYCEDCEEYIYEQHDPVNMGSTFTGEDAGCVEDPAHPIPEAHMGAHTIRDFAIVPEPVTPSE